MLCINIFLFHSFFIYFPIVKKNVSYTPLFTGNNSLLYYTNSFFTKEIEDAVDENGYHYKITGKLMQRFLYYWSQSIGPLIYVDSL